MADVQVLVKDGNIYLKSQYDQRIVNFMRTRPTRFWNKTSKEWVIPEQDLDKLMQLLKSFDYEITYAKQQEVNISDTETSPIPSWYEFKTQPFKHQVEGLEYSLSHPKYLLADEPGLGKSKAMLDLACILKKEAGIKHVLVIACVNGLKYNWQNEVGIHTNEKSFILGTRYNKKGEARIGSNEDRLADIESIGKNPEIDDCYFIITNIETLRYNKTVQVPLKTKKNGIQRFKKQTVFPIVEELQKQINDGNIGMIVADESHKCLGKDTRVQTDQGLISIKDIVEKQCYKVKTLNSDGTYSFVEPVNYFENPVEDTLIELCILLDNGHTVCVRCTPDHKLLTKNRGYVKASDICETDIIFE